MWYWYGHSGYMISHLSIYQYISSSKYIETIKPMPPLVVAVFQQKLTDDSQRFSLSLTCGMCFCFHVDMWNAQWACSMSTARGWQEEVVQVADNSNDTRRSKLITPRKRKCLSRIECAAACCMPLPWKIPITPTTCQ